MSDRAADVRADAAFDAAQAALDAAQAAGADYADVRAMAVRSQAVSTKHGRPNDVRDATEHGLAVRVLAGGAWGFAALPDPGSDSAAAAAREAVLNARATGSRRRKPVELAPEPPHQTVWETPRTRNPFQVPVREKLDLLAEASARLEEAPGVAVGEAAMSFVTEAQRFLSSEGSDITQTLHFAGCGMSATSTGPGGIQRRSYPNSWGQWIGGGYELVDELDLLGHTDSIATEAAALQQADLCPTGEFDLILDPKQLALQIHESVGHPLELDRVLGGEANYAGTSFATTDQLGRLRYGSDVVSITADATLPRGLATFGYDDEGVAAQTWPLIDRGTLSGYLTSREYAAAVDESRSRGTMRAEGWRRVPIIRMVNISLEPDPSGPSLAELVADTKRGLLMSTNRSWSIDQRRVNFQFGCEIAWEIENGRLTRMLRNPVYQGITTEFWRSCDAVCNEREWQPWGVYNCGKGQPSQRAEMTHGSSPARFRGVRCGVAG